MPWRLIQFIIIFTILLVFTAFNLRNNCDINFGFSVIKEVPVYLTAFTAFILGMLCALPFVIKTRIKSGNTVSGHDKKPGKPGKPGKTLGKKEIETSEKSEDSSFSDGGPYGVN